MSLPIPRRTRRRLLRILLLAFIAWNLLEVHLTQRRIWEAEAEIAYRDQPDRTERIYIASVNWNSEPILRSHWNQALLELAWKLGPENVHISIYESGSFDNTKDALAELDAELQHLQIPHTIVMSPITHEDELAATPGEGWIETPTGEMGLRRIPYLSRERNRSLQPLEQLANQGILFDKVLFLNDVVFTVGSNSSVAHRNTD